MCFKPLTKRPAWKALAAHHKTNQKLHLRKLFADDAEARRKIDRRSRRAFFGLFQKSHHGQNAETVIATRGRIRLARED
jgi:hypothetical protein